MKERDKRKGSKIIIVDPPFCEDPAKPWTFIDMECLGIAYLTAALEREGLDVNAVHGNVGFWTLKQVTNLCLREQYSVACIAVSSQRSCAVSLELARVLSEAGKFIIVGGHFATIAYQEIMEACPYISCLIRGEAESSLPSVVKAVLEEREWYNVPGVVYHKDGKVMVGPAWQRLDLNTLAWPNRGYLADTGPDRLRAVGIISSKGCKSNCSFCSNRRFYESGVQILRDPGNVVDEIQDIYERYGWYRFHMRDEDFLGHQPEHLVWARSFQDMIKRRRLPIRFRAMMRCVDAVPELLLPLKEAGLRHVDLGIESASPNQIRRYRKPVTPELSSKAVNNIRKCGLSVAIFFIMFDPDVVLEELQHNFDWLRTNKCFWRRNLTDNLNPFYGTPIAEELHTRGILNEYRFDVLSEYEFQDVKIREYWRLLGIAKHEYLPMKQRVAQLGARARGLDEDNEPDLVAAMRQLYQTEANVWLEMMVEMLNRINIPDTYESKVAWMKERSGRVIDSLQGPVSDVHALFSSVNVNLPSERERE